MLQKERDRPAELTQAERKHLYDLRHTKENSQYKKQYRQDHAEELKQNNKQYKQDHAEEIKQRRQQREQDRQQTRAEYAEYLQNTLDEPKNNFEDWCEQKLMVIEAPEVLQQIKTEPDEELAAKLEKLLKTL